MTLYSSKGLPLWCVGVPSAALYAWLATVSTGYAAAGVVDAVVVFGGTAVLFAVLVLHCAWRAPAYDPIRVLLWALLLRLLALWAWPVLEDDYFRYLWDGHITWLLGSPYGIAPLDVTGHTPAFDNLLDGINHPNVPTVYGPTLQWWFALANLVSPAAIWPLQVSAALFDLTLLILLWRLAPHACWWLWAFAPLALKEFANTAHPDVLGAMLLAAALLARRHGYWWLLAVCAGAAAGVKPFAWVAIPFLLGRNLRAWLGCGVTLLLLSAPFLPHSSLFDVWLPDGLRAMGANWYFNAPLYHAAAALSLPLAELKAAALLLFALLWVRWWYTAMRQDVSETLLIERLFVLYGVLCLISPVLNPWYLVWWVVFAVQGRGVTVWVASIAVFASYATPINLGLHPGVDPSALYHVPGWALWLQAGAVAVALAVDWRRGAILPTPRQAPA